MLTATHAIKAEQIRSVFIRRSTVVVSGNSAHSTEGEGAVKRFSKKFYLREPTARQFSAPGPWPVNNRPIYPCGWPPAVYGEDRRSSKARPGCRCEGLHQESARA